MPLESRRKGSIDINLNVDLGMTKLKAFCCELVYEQWLPNDMTHVTNQFESSPAQREVKNLDPDGERCKVHHFELLIPVRWLQN